MPDTTATDTSIDITDTATADTSADTSTTATVVEKDWQAEAEKWKSLSRKHEGTAKANAEAAARLAEIEDANATELEKANKRAEQAEQTAADTAAQLAIAQAAVKHGLSGDDLDLLGTHGTAEEIDARAEKLSTRLKAAGDAKVKPDFGGGDRGDDVTAGGAQLSQDDVKRLMAAGKHDEVTKAKAEGRLDTLLGIK